MEEHDLLSYKYGIDPKIPRNILAYTQEQAQQHGAAWRKIREEKGLPVSVVATLMWSDKKVVQRIEAGLGVQTNSLIRYLLILGVLK